MSRRYARPHPNAPATAVCQCIHHEAFNRNSLRDFRTHSTSRRYHRNPHAGQEKGSHEPPSTTISSCSGFLGFATCQQGNLRGSQHVILQLQSFHHRQRRVWQHQVSDLVLVVSKPAPLRYYRSINIQALQRFIACIPSQHLAQIRMLGMPLYIRHPPFCYDGFYFNSDGSRYLARSMMKTFTGVTNLLFYVPDNQPHVSLNSQAFWTQKMSDEWRNKWGMLIQDEKLQDFVQSLLKHEKLENIIAGITLDNEEVQESLQSIVEGSETAERVTITQVVRPIRRRLWGLEGISRL